MPSAAPSTPALTRPTRRPVYGPGPTPTAMPVRSCGDAPASAMTLAMTGASSSAWRCASTVTSWASGWPPSCSATVTAGVAVSRPSSSTSNEGSRSERLLGDLRRHFLGNAVRRGGEVAHRDGTVLLAAAALVKAVNHDGDDDVTVADVDVGHVRDRAAPVEHLGGLEGGRLRTAGHPCQVRHRGLRRSRLRPGRGVPVLERLVGVLRGEGGAAVP